MEQGYLISVCFILILVILYSQYISLNVWTTATVQTRNRSKCLHCLYHNFELVDTVWSKELILTMSDAVWKWGIWNCFLQKVEHRLQQSSPLGIALNACQKNNKLQQNIWQTLYARTKKDKTAFRKLRHILNAVNTVHNVEATNTKTHAY